MLGLGGCEGLDEEGGGVWQVWVPYLTLRMIDGHATQNGQWVRHSCVGAVDFLSVGDCFDSFVG